MRSVLKYVLEDVRSKTLVFYLINRMTFAKPLSKFCEIIRVSPSTTGFLPCLW